VSAERFVMVPLSVTAPRTGMVAGDSAAMLTCSGVGGVGVSARAARPTSRVTAGRE
jgi:hypothetical protein